MKRLNKAFTLTELLVALGVVAILCSVLLPIIFNMMPNQNTIMAKRAYYTTQTIVADLINDEACYPDKTSASVASEIRIGFDDAAGSPNCIGWGADKLESEDSGAKFAALFSKKLGKDTTMTNNVARFVTDDGMQWAITNPSFASTGDGGYIDVTVDVNGSNAPNCGGGDSRSYSVELGSGNDNDCKDRKNGYDRFKMKINGNGKITINDNDVWAQNAVKVDRNISGNGTSNDNDQ